MIKELPEELFRDFGHDEQSRTITWSNIISIINKDPNLHYEQLLEKIMNSAEQGEICLEFVEKMGILDRLNTDCPTLSKIFNFLVQRALNRSISSLLVSRDLNVLAILLLLQEVNRKFFILLLQSSLGVLQDESNENFHSLAILSFFLNKLHGVMSGNIRGPQVESWVDNLLVTIVEKWRPMPNFNLSDAQKSDYYLQISNTLCKMCKSRQSLTKRFPQQICLEYISGEKLQLVKGSKNLAQKFFEALSYSSIRLFTDQNKYVLENEILSMTETYCLSSSSIIEFWRNIIENSNLYQNLPPYFPDILLVNYYKKPSCIEEAVNKLKLSALLAKTFALQAKFDFAISIKACFENSCHNPEKRDHISFLRIALEMRVSSQFRLDSEKKASVVSELENLDKKICEFYVKEDLELLEIEIVNFLPCLKFLSEIDSKFFSQHSIEKNIVFFCVKIIAKYDNESFCSEIQHLLSTIFKGYKIYYQYTSQIRKKLQIMLSICLDIVKEVFRDNERLGRIGNVLEEFFQIFANMESLSLLEQLLNLIEVRRGYFDESLQRIGRKLIAAINFKDSYERGSIFDKIFRIFILNDRPLYFSLFLDFTEKYKESREVQQILFLHAGKVEYVVNRLDHVYPNNHIRYLNSIALMECTQNVLTDEHFFAIAQKLKCLVPNLEGIKQAEYQKIFEIVRKSISSIKKITKTRTISFRFAEPFVTLLRRAIERIRFKVDNNICTPNQEGNLILNPVFSIVQKLSDLLREITLSTKAIDQSEKKKCEHLFKNLAELLQCKWVSPQETSFRFKLNILVSVMWLKFIAPEATPRSLFPYQRLEIQLDNMTDKFSAISLGKKYEEIFAFMAQLMLDINPDTY